MSSVTAIGKIYRAAKGIEGDDETTAWHMLADIIEWCEAQKPPVNFDAMLQDVREFLSSEGGKHD